jgi:hypothetical protein
MVIRLLKIVVADVQLPIKHRSYLKKGQKLIKTSGKYRTVGNGIEE